jgi:hypothetical protein
MFVQKELLTRPSIPPNRGSHCSGDIQELAFRPPMGRRQRVCKLPGKHTPFGGIRIGRRSGRKTATCRPLPTQNFPGCIMIPQLETSWLPLEKSSHDASCVRPASRALAGVGPAVYQPQLLAGNRVDCLHKRRGRINRVSLPETGVWSRSPAHAWTPAIRCRRGRSAGVARRALRRRRHDGKR